jgi:hypothetical protein
MNPWLSAAADAIATTTGLPRTSLNLSDPAIQTLLELARNAAHDSGQRTNAPLICYLVGLSVATSEKSLDEIANTVPGADPVA